MKMRLSLKTGLIAILFVSFLSHANAQKRIAVIGSSSVVGYFPPSSGYTKDSAWVYKLKKYYKDLGIIDTLFNLGQSSTDCFEGMPSSYVPPAGFNYRMPNPNINITKAINMVPKPDVIIVSYPSNNYDWISNEQVISCLQIIKDSANAKNISCYITSTQPRNTFSPSERLKLKNLRNMIMDHFGQFAIDFFTNIAEEPTLNIKPEYNIGDGIHLTPSGHTILKDRVLEKNILSATLPLKFTEFRVAPFQQKIIVKWETENEEANQQFIIENSLDGRNFTAIGNLNGKLGSTKNQYEFIHRPANREKQFYRIKSVNVLGITEYSSIVSLKIKEDVLPVQFKFIQPQLIIYYNEDAPANASINIFSTDGKLVFSEQRKINSNEVVKLKINSLRKGTYSVKISYNHNKATDLFIVP